MAEEEVVNVSGFQKPLTETSNTVDGIESTTAQTQLPAFVLDSSAQDDEHDMDFPTLQSRYILKHNRPPPSGYQEWYNYAKDRKCYLDRYDAIYKDLAPFEGLGKEEFRHRLELAKKAPRTSVIEVRNGKIANSNHYVDHVSPSESCKSVSLLRWICTVCSIPS